MCSIFLNLKYLIFQVNVLMGNLEGLPVSARMSNGRSSSYSLQKFRKMQSNSTSTSIIDHQNEEEGSLSKSDVTLQFTLEVRVVNYQVSSVVKGMREVWARFPGQSIGRSIANGSPPLRCFFGAVLPRRLTAKMDPAARFTLRRNTAGTIKIWSFYLVFIVTKRC